MRSGYASDQVQPLHPQARAVLDAMPAAGAAAGELPSIEEMRRLQVVDSQFSGTPEPVGAVRDIGVEGQAGPIAVRLYFPDAPPPHAMVMFVHGGGWVLGSVELSDTLCRALCLASGMLIASVEYRLAPEHPFPAGLDDVYSALGWLHANAGELGATPGLLAVCGDSAGGNLAAAVALRARDEHGPSLALQCLIYPALDPTLAGDSYERLATGYGLTKDEMRRFWDLYLARAEDAANPYASPMRAADLSGVAPALILTAEYDPLVDDGELYGEMLRGAGVRARTVSYPGMIHGFVSCLGWIDDAHAAVDECAAALKDAMATQSAST
jgi:acetyl esterase